MPKRGPKSLELGSIAIEGPSEAEVGTELEFKAVIESADIAEVAITWEVHGPESVNAEVAADVPFTVTLSEVGEYTVVATAQALEVQGVSAEHKLRLVPSVPEEVPPDDSGQEDETTSLKLVGSAIGSLPPQGFTIIAAGDLTGDQVPDLVAGSPDTRRIVLFEGRRDGTYTERVTVSAGLSPEELLVADFTGNSLADIVAISWSANEATLLRSNSPFQLSAPSALSLPEEVWGAWARSLGGGEKSELVWLTDEGPLVWSFLENGQVQQSTTVLQAWWYPLPVEPLYAWFQMGETTGLIAYEKEERRLALTLADRSARSIGELPSGLSFHALASAPGPQQHELTLLGLDQLGRIHTLRFASR